MQQPCRQRAGVAAGAEHGHRRLDRFDGKIQEEGASRSRSPLTWEFHRIPEGVAKKLRGHREELFAPNVKVRVSLGGIAPPRQKDTRLRCPLPR